MFIIQTNTDFCCLFIKILFLLHRELINELSVSKQGKQKERTDILINTIGKALGQIQNHSIFKKQVLLPPPTTRQGSVDEVLKRIAEVNCSYRPTTPKELISAKMGGQELSVSIQAKK